MHSKLFTAICFSVFTKSIVTAKFEAYRNNGGLVAAVAGRGYVLIASDTRLSEGYGILSRDHSSSRLWEATNTGFFDRESMENLQLKEIYQADQKGIGTPVFVGSSGCTSDCIALQRRIRAEMSAHTSWILKGDGDAKRSIEQSLTPREISVFLMNVLYERRFFPFYAFCIVAGLNGEKNKEDGNGAVYVYDAIGSNERVAVAAAGTGREMMQPILDRLFSTSNLKEIDVNEFLHDKDQNDVEASKQVVGNSLLPPVKTFVSCSSDQAITRIRKAYRSVAEREIAVGDEVVVLVIERNYAGECTTKHFKFPLKLH